MVASVGSGMVASVGSDEGAQYNWCYRVASVGSGEHGCLGRQWRVSSSDSLGRLPVVVGMWKYMVLCCSVRGCRLVVAVGSPRWLAEYAVVYSLAGCCGPLAASLPPFPLPSL